MSVSEKKFGVLQTGETAKIFHLENKSGAYAEVTDFGAILVKVCVPDKDGVMTDVVLGYDDLASDGLTSGLRSWIPVEVDVGSKKEGASHISGYSQFLTDFYYTLVYVLFQHKIYN